MLNDPLKAGREMRIACALGIASFFGLAY